jgi:hypothetical protein
LILFSQNEFGGIWHPFPVGLGCQGFTEPVLSTLLHKISSVKRSDCGTNVCPILQKIKYFAAGFLSVGKNRDCFLMHSQKKERMLKYSYKNKVRRDSGLPEGIFKFEPDTCPFV